MGIDYLIQDGAHLKERLFERANGQSMLVIFDDMMNSVLRIVLEELVKLRFKK